jgi:hypothetical protein
MEKITNTYEAVASDGSKVTVYEVQDLDIAGTSADPGPKRMQLSDGRRLKMVGERQFMIESTGEAFLLDRPYVP